MLLVSLEDRRREHAACHDEQRWFEPIARDCCQGSVQGFLAGQRTAAAFMSRKRCRVPALGKGADILPALM